MATGINNRQNGHIRMKIIGIITARSNRIGLSDAYRLAHALPPRRGMIIEPRATPWVWHHKETPALKGRHKDWPDKGGRTVKENGFVISPFQGLYMSRCLPRALPWAVICRPFRAKNVRSADFPVCRIAGFPTCGARMPKRVWCYDALPIGKSAERQTRKSALQF